MNPHEDVKSRRAVIEQLVKTMGEIVSEQERLHTKLTAVQSLLALVLTEPDNADDVDMDGEVTVKDENPEAVDFDSVRYCIGDKVEIKDVKYGFTSAKENEAIIVKFCEKMVRVKLSNGKSTTRKYGNFKHVVPNE